MKIINNKCSNCGYDGKSSGWCISNPICCPKCDEKEESTQNLQLKTNKQTEN